MKNKEETKRKLIRAVGTLIQTEGFKALNIAKVARLADVDRNLVYRYFQNLDGLTEAYVLENDYWMSFEEHLTALLAEMQEAGSEALVIRLLQDQFQFFLGQKDLQNLILLELSEDNPLLRSIHRARESLGERILALTDEHFRESNVNLRAISALLVGGIYYVILHTRFNGNRFSGLDIGSREDQDALIRSIAQIIHWAFRQKDGD